MPRWSKRAAGGGVEVAATVPEARRQAASPTERRSREPGGTSCAGPADRARPRARLPGRVVRAALREPLAAAGGDDPLGAVHRRDGEPGDAASVRRVSRPARAGGRTGGGARGDRQADGVLPPEGEDPAGGGAHPRRAARRTGAADDGGALRAPRGGAEDRE